MKISVIIPVYNVEKFIRQCLDSILSQSYKNYEVILIDDKSPPTAPKAPLIALNLAVPVKLFTAYRRASLVVVSCAVAKRELPKNMDNNNFFISIFFNL
jgi:glycosyltransferase involved in cell wall biosynthesis